MENPVKEDMVILSFDNNIHINEDFPCLRNKIGSKTLDKHLNDCIIEATFKIEKESENIQILGKNFDEIQKFPKGKPK